MAPKELPSDERLIQYGVKIRVKAFEMSKQCVLTVSFDKDSLPPANHPKISISVKRNTTASCGDFCTLFKKCDLKTTDARVTAGATAEGDPLKHIYVPCSAKLNQPKGADQTEFNVRSVEVGCSLPSSSTLGRKDIVIAESITFGRRIKR